MAFIDSVLPTLQLQSYRNIGSPSKNIAFGFLPFPFTTFLCALLSLFIKVIITQK